MFTSKSENQAVVDPQRTTCDVMITLIAVVISISRYTTVRADSYGIRVLAFRMWGIGISAVQEQLSSIPYVLHRLWDIQRPDNKG